MVTMLFLLFLLFVSCGKEVVTPAEEAPAEEAPAEEPLVEKTSLTMYALCHTVYGRLEMNTEVSLVDTCSADAETGVLELRLVNDGDPGQWFEVHVGTWAGAGVYGASDNASPNWVQVSGKLVYEDGYYELGTRFIDYATEDNCTITAGEVDEAGLMSVEVDCETLSPAMGGTCEITPLAWSIVPLCEAG